MQLDVGHFVLAIIGIMIDVRPSALATWEDRVFLSMLGLMLLLLAFLWQAANQWQGLSAAFAIAMFTYIAFLGIGVLAGWCFGAILASFKKRASLPPQ